jgi:hydroxymethylbilane synthase
MNELRIATRRSRLALAQSASVAAALESAHPGIGIRTVEVTTTGDADRVSPVATLTEIGAFVRAVQQAVIEGAADLAVHSCKDLPVAGPEGLTLVHPRREEPWDVLCGYALGSLRRGGRVGTGSPRRRAQLAVLRPDLRIDEIRGNVDTRLAMVESGEFDAIVVAEAGLRRLDRARDIDHRFGIDQMVPAPAQGALAVEVVEGSEAHALVAALDHPPTRRAVEAERALLALTGAGCRSALGGYAEDTSAGITLAGFVDDERGPRRAHATHAEPRMAAELLRTRLGI